MNEVSAETIELLRQAGTGIVSDALAMLGVQGALEGIWPARGFEDATVVGPAATILYATARPGTAKLSHYGVIERLAAGSVLVVDGNGIGNHFCGDNVGNYAKQRGLVGVVVYGGARDLAGWRRVGMPLFCTSPATRARPDSLEIAGYNVPVEIGGVVIKAGDVIVADEDGVVSIPIEGLEETLDKVKAVAAVEDAMQAAIARGAPAAELAGIISRKKARKA
ncbi:MAG: RraA family protein [Anaerolineae bacterium]|nr:RraA family protein [Anaerolineae bacterium]